MTLKYRYLSDGSQNYVGVPARDLTDEDVDLLTDEQKKLVAASPLYEAVSGKTTSKNVAEEDEA